MLKSCACFYHTLCQCRPAEVLLSFTALWVTRFSSKLPHRMTFLTTNGLLNKGIQAEFLC